MRQFGVTRGQAMRLAGPEFARPVRPRPPARCSKPWPPPACRSWSSSATAAACRSTPGPIHRVEAVGHWLNVLDPGFNLHLREDRVTAS